MFFSVATSRPESIKTRIETVQHLRRNAQSGYLRAQNPLKQGLKHENNVLKAADTDKLRAQNPLKQGLKPVLVTRIMKSSQLRAQNPLKQGLKPKALPAVFHASAASRPESIKTRIETAEERVFALGVFFLRAQNPLKQGLKLTVI